MTTDLTDAELEEYGADAGIGCDHLITVRMAREILRRRAARAVPPAIQSGLDRYANHGIAPGSCLRAVLEGDLFAAFSRADPVTAHAMPAIIAAITRQVPGPLFGSPEAVSRHLAQMARVERSSR